MGLFGAIAREVKFVSGALRTLNRVKDAGPDSPVLAPDDIEKVVDKHPNNIAFIFNDERLTYREFDEGANRVANWALSMGLAPGDTVALFMPNRPEYVAIWYGLTKVGVVCALLNNQLTGQSLGHCVNVADAKHLIIDGELADTAAAARAFLNQGPRLWVFEGQMADADSFDGALSEVSDARPPRSHREGLTGKDVALKMFTSGTTGLPKAARVTHMRVQNYMNAFSAASMAKPKDRMMLVLPLYHATGGLCGVGVVLTVGGAIVLEKRFSASAFWDVAVKHKATLFMYVGELCRFLASAPPHPKERKHRIRCAIGNGLRPDVWERFQNRFHIPWIIEFYGATEGNVSLINPDGTVGAIGRIPRFLENRFNVRLVKFDLDKEEPVRGEDGFCLRAEPGEVGEALGEIRLDEARFSFDGYAGSKEQTEKKILRDAFEKGDAWFRTGDLMRQDKLGYFYFVDRIGDTFRWKSENVATSEVAEALGVFDGVEQANVYGVPVPGYDGKAGMAAISAENGLDLSALYSHLERELPAYARPVFLRLHGGEDDAHTTGTFKLKKTDLVKEGFDPKTIDEPLYFLDSKAGAFVPLDADLYDRIQAGDVRV